MSYQAGKMEPTVALAQDQPADAACGWQAQLTLTLGTQAGKTRVLQQRHLGPLRVQRAFYPEGETCHLYLLHPPGGVVGGDALATQVTLQPGARALLTMPGAAKIYRSGGATAQIQQQLRLQAESALEWLPPGNIFFPGCAAQLASDIHLTSGARLIAWETYCFGRPVMGEAFDRGEARILLRLWRDGRLWLNESLNVCGGLATLAGYPLHSTLLMTPADEALLEAVRAQLATREAPAGATLLDDLLVVRLLDNSNLRLEADLQQLWRLARPQVMGLEARPPRIWST